MASAPPTLPLLFNDLRPLSSVEHADRTLRQIETMPVLHTTHAIPVTVEEFGAAQRHYPIVFTAGDNPVPLALMGLNEGVNTFFDAEGRLIEPVYVPAFIRRYPFLLARLAPDAQELSLCFDPTTPIIGGPGEGEPLFEDGKPAEVVQRVLTFCEQFEQAGAKTSAFVAELQEHKLLMEGEVAIQIDEATQPFVYRGFQMVNEQVLRDLRGDVLRRMMQSGLLSMVHAHLLSLNTMRDIFGRQQAQGTAPAAVPITPAPAVPPAG